MTQSLEKTFERYQNVAQGQTLTIPYRYLAASEHIAYFENSSNEVISYLNLGVDAVIAPDGDTPSNTGQMVLNMAPPTGAAHLVISRKTTPVQNYNASPGAEGVEASLDRRALIDQETAQSLNHTLKLPIGSMPLYVPIPSAGRYLKGREDEAGWENGRTDDEFDALLASSVASEALQRANADNLLNAGLTAVEQDLQIENAGRLAADQVLADVISGSSPDGGYSGRVYYSTQSQENVDNAALRLVPGAVFEMAGLKYVLDDTATTAAHAPFDGARAPEDALFTHWPGVVGDWSGTTGTNCTTGINSAMRWLAAATGRSLHLPSGWFYYDGELDLDFNGNKWATITTQGRIWHGSSATVGNPVAWTLHNLENLSMDLRLHGGGVVGDFAQRSPNDGGTTFVKLHRIRWGRKVNIEAMDYAGRVIHATAEATDSEARARNLKIIITAGNRNTNPENVKCGQTIYADSNACVQTGSWGSVEVRSEGNVHGPVFERLNDVRIPCLEMGLFTASGFEIRGCRAVFADFIYCGQSDNSSSPTVSLIPSAAGRKSGDIVLTTVRSLTATAGVYAESFEPSGLGLVIGSVGTTQGVIGVHVKDMPYVKVDTVHGENLDNLIKIEGSNGRLDFGLGESNNVYADAVLVDDAATCNQLNLSGNADSCGAGFSLVNLGPLNNETFLDGLHLSSNVATQLVNIGFAGTNKVRMVGGSVGGSSDVFNATRRPEVIRDVRGLQSEACGVATILSGTNAVVVTHNIDVNPTFIALSGHGSSDVASPYVLETSPTTTFTIRTAANVTADRKVRWEVSGVYALNDFDA